MRNLGHHERRGCPSHLRALTALEQPRHCGDDPTKWRRKMDASIKTLAPRGMSLRVKQAVLVAENLLDLRAVEAQD